MPTAHIMRVLHTSAKDLDIGLILFDIVTAIGTETEILTIRQHTKITTSAFCDIWSKNTLKLSRTYSPSTMTQLLLSLHGQETNWPVKLKISIKTKP